MRACDADRKRVIVFPVPPGMNINLQRTIDRFVGVPLCGLFSLLHHLHQPAPLTEPPRRVLVILLSEMGSLVLGQAMFARLKEKYPDAAIHVLLYARSREVLDLLGIIPQENVLTVNDRSLKQFGRDCFNVLRAMRALNFDVVIDCELFARASSIFSYLSGARVRVGFHRYTQEGLYRGSFINRPVLYNPYKHIAQQFLALVEAIESGTVPVGKESVIPRPGPPPMLSFPETELQQVAAQLHADFPAIKDKSLVLVYPSGGILPIRAWPLENYRRLCAELLNAGHAVGIIGLPEDKSLGQDIMAHCRSAHCVDLTGYTKSIRHLLALFQHASLLITNDGGPGQFAAITPMPTIILFGPETPALYGSLAKNVFCFHLPLPCSPCLTAYNHRLSPCDGDNQCLKRITPEQVLARALEMIKLKDACPS
jgi:lipopolysaccharide heptosyltransferase II